MWFGDLVTMTWWDDLWLNESFAEWASHHGQRAATRYTDAWTTFSNQRKAWAYRQDQLPSTHPIAADMVDLDAVRGELRRHHLRQGRLGAAPARRLGRRGRVPGRPARVLRPASRGATPGCADLLGGAGGGVRPRPVRLDRRVAGDRRASTPAAAERRRSTTRAATRRSRACVQEPPASPPGVAATLRSHRIALGLYDDRRRPGAHATALEIDVVGDAHRGPRAGRTPAAGPAARSTTTTSPSPRSGSTSGRWRPRSHASASCRTRSLARALLWGAAWDMTRDAEMSPRATTSRLVAVRGAPRDRHRRRSRPCCARLKTAHRPLRRPDRPATRPGRAGATPCWRLARARREPAATTSSRSSGPSRRPPRPPSSGRPSGACSTEPDVLPGLAVDTDLRWALLQRLVAVGLAGDGRVDAELGPGRHGHRTAAGDRWPGGAARPPQAKAAAWSDGRCDDDDLPNALLAATDRRVHAARPARAASAPYVDALLRRDPRGGGSSAPPRWPR